MTILDAFQYSGAAVGILGSLFVALKGRDKKFFGFMMFLLANILLGIFYVGTGPWWGLIAMCCVYSVTAGIGVWNHAPER